MPLSHCCLQVLQVVYVVAHVADGGDTARDVEHSVDRLNVHVHIEEAGKQCLTRCHRYAGRCREFSLRQMVRPA